MLLKLEGKNIRNLDNFSVRCCPSANIIYGKNGSGKTSLLEAIYLLGRGRSFRNRDAKTVIKAGQSELVVSAQFDRHQSGIVSKIGVLRSSKGGFEARQDGRVIRTAGELAAQLPIQLIHAQSFLLLEGGALQRRQFLDWGVFHVEHSYMRLWRRYHKALKQRNQLLRHDRLRSSELDLWSRELVGLSNLVAEKREEYLQLLIEEVSNICIGINSFVGMSIEYYRGWDYQNNLEEILVKDLERDRKYGKTHQGAHRADLVVRIGGAPVASFLSRGQIKSLVYVLKLAQAAIFQRKTGLKCIFLLDDLPSELDFWHRDYLLTSLNQLSCQYFMTGVDRKDFVNVIGKNSHQIFHIDKGQLASCYN